MKALDKGVADVEDSVLTLTVKNKTNDMVVNAQIKELEKVLPFMNTTQGKAKKAMMEVKLLLKD